MKTLTPDEPRFVVDALKAISDGEDLVVRVDGPAVMEIVSTVQRFPLDLSGFLSTLPKSSIPSDMKLVLGAAGSHVGSVLEVLPVLVAIGGLSAAAGCIGGICAFGLSKGREVGISMRINDPFTPRDDEMFVHVSGAARSGGK